MLSSPVENTPNHPRSRITRGPAASANSDHEMKIAMTVRHTPALVTEMQRFLGARANGLFASSRSFRPICAIIALNMPIAPILFLCISHLAHH